MDTIDQSIQEAQAILDRYPVPAKHFRSSSDEIDGLLAVTEALLDIVRQLHQQLQAQQAQP